VALRFDIDGGIATVMLSNPETLNALDLETMQALADAWQRIEADDSIRVAILTGEGERAFCAGADLKTLLPKILAGGVQEAVGPEGPVFAKFLLSKPVIAAVRGICVAGGTELLQVADIRVASEDARFGLAEARWALFPAGGSTVRLPRQIPYCRAMEMLLTGSQVSAQEALQMGLVNRVVPTAEVDRVAREYAERILANGPLAVRAIKRAVLSAYGLPLREAFKVEAEIAQEIFRTEDAREGPRAFSEKRSPVFTGR
jgi:enoyl-CoA hydratase